MPYPLTQLSLYWTRILAPQSYLETELNNLIQNDLSTWEFLQQGSLDGIWYWDLEKPDNEWMSPEFWRVFGIDPTTKKHDPAEWQDIIFQEDLAVALENFDAHCADPNHPYDQIVRFLHADGSTVWVRCRGLAIRDETGKPLRMLGAHTDLTSVKRSEESARTARRSAENANSELKSFAYSVSHDLKAPTNTLKLLMGELNLLTDGLLNEDAQEVLSMASDTVDRMQNLIENVLDYTRTIGTEADFEHVSLKDCAEAAIANLRADILESNAEITLGDLPELDAVESQMITLFQNLIGNAIRYRKSDHPPVIDISASNEKNHEIIQIKVRDNGIGIAPKNHDRIFALFQRLHTYDDIGGIGLGLPMCKRIVLNHKGNLKVNSDLGQGATFTVCLPWRLT